MGNVDEDDALKHRIDKLGFKPQKEKPYNMLLPYSDRLDGESSEFLAAIKANLEKAVLMRELRPGCEFWTARLSTYIKLYGLKFSKEDHIAFINLLYELTTIPNLEPLLINEFASLLVKLLKKRQLVSRDELVLPWRPLYDLCTRVMDTSYVRLGIYRYFSLNNILESLILELNSSLDDIMDALIYAATHSLPSTLETLIHVAKFYFPLSATQEMLDEWRPVLCPFSSSMGNAMRNLEWFLPIALPPDKNHLGHELWLSELMKLWEVFHNDTSWEGDIMWLIARLAYHNIGYIDWEPYVPVMFARFLRNFNLPVKYKAIDTSKYHTLETPAIALWIVSVVGKNSSAQTYLDKFMKTLESYFYPANRGWWIASLGELVKHLPLYFITRLHRERYEKDTWQTPIPDSFKLTDDDVTKFVESMKPAVIQTFSSHNANMFSNQALLYLATLRPELIIPSILEKIYSTLETLTEPHKVTAAMQCVAAVTRPIVQGGTFKEGPSHVLPLLMGILPGIDPNDTEKFIYTCVLVSAFVTMVPIVDCSSASDYWSDLTEDELSACISTGNFEEFVLQFLDRMFALIDSSVIQETRLESKGEKSDLEATFEEILLGTCSDVLEQASPSIFLSALNKLQSFVTGRILETNIGGHLVATICQSFVEANPKETFQLLLPQINGLILSLTESEEVLKEEHLDQELLFNLLLLSKCVCCQGKHLLTYGPQLIQILDRTLHLVCKEGYLLACEILRQMLASLTILSPLEIRSSPNLFDRPISEYLPIRDWGKAGDIHELGLKWFIPGTEEIACVQTIVSRYLPPEIECIFKFVNAEEALTRDQLERSLRIILSIFGCGSFLPSWEEEPLKLLQSCVPLDLINFTVGLEHKRVTMPDGNNIRKTVSDCMDLILDKVLSCKEDDTKCLLRIIDIYDHILFGRLMEKRFYNVDWEGYYLEKHILEDKLVGNKKHLRSILIHRTVLQHTLRLKESANVSPTPTHKKIMVNLFKLSTSRYSKVRSRAQQVLFTALFRFRFSYSLIIPEIVKCLKQEALSHEELKGTLYVLLGPREHPLIVQHDWENIAALWLTVIQTPPSEKLSVVNLLTKVTEMVRSHFPTIAIDADIPDRCLEAARRLCAERLQTDTAGGIEKLEERNQSNRRTYLTLVDSLLEIIEKGSLQWRYFEMGVNFLRDLVHPDIPYASNVVRFFLNTLIDDSLRLRKIAIRVTLLILKQQKRPHKKIKINPHNFYPNNNNNNNKKNENICPGNRPNNAWLQYNSKYIPKTKDEWEKRYFIHKNFHGYYCWPEALEVYAPSSEQPKLDRTWEELNDVEKEIHNFFSTQGNIDMLVEYFSMEENKGLDMFNDWKFLMFKALFRNHGDEYLKYFKSHLERLVKDKNENCQIFAAEFIAGLIRGAKHWSFDKLQSLWKFLTPIIRTALANITEETVSDWGKCFTSASYNRDPNHNHWLLEILIEEPLENEVSAVACGKLGSLQCALNQQEWREAELLYRLLEYLRPYLAHELQSIRGSVASVLSNIFHPDIVYHERLRTTSPHISDFVFDILPKLEVLYQDNFELLVTFKDSNILERDQNLGANSKAIVRNQENMEVSSEEREISIRLLKTICIWIAENISGSVYATVSEFYNFFPLVSLMESNETDEDLGKHCRVMLASLAQAFTLPKHVPVVFASVNMVANCESWWARSSCLSFLQVFVFYNMPIIMSEKKWAEQVIDIVLKLLEDERLEVREKAAEVLGGLLHCDFIPSAMELLDLFKSTCKSTPNNIKTLIIRHSGVLGICAFINAHPYDIPDYLPDIFVVLENHFNDPQPIPSTIRKTLSDFKRTHHCNWEDEKKKFTEDQLAIISDLVVPPTYIV